MLSDQSLNFSRAYGTYLAGASFPSNELLGYFRFVPTGQ